MLEPKLTALELFPTQPLSDRNGNHSEIPKGGTGMSVAGYCWMSSAGRPRFRKTDDA